MERFENQTGDLRRRYRSVQAPPYFAARIRTQVRSQRATKHFSRPAFAAIAVVIAIFGFLPFIANKETTSEAGPALPSLTSLSRLTADHPTSISPSLSRLRSVSMPSMPARPRSQPGNNPQSHYESGKYQKPKEKNHEYV